MGVSLFVFLLPSVVEGRGRGFWFGELMDLESVECVSSSDGMDEDEIHANHHHSEFSSTKPRNGGTSNINSVGPNGIAPATSVHELLECPVCTNSMYPPIHQVCSFTNFNISCLVSFGEFDDS